MKTLKLFIVLLAAIFLLSCEKEEDLNKQPSVPILQTPENGSVTDNNAVTFEWKESTDPENDDIYYTLYVSNDSLNWKSYEAYNGITLNNLDNNSPKFYPFEPGLKYYWKVSAINDSYNNAIDQELDNTSDVFHFFTILSSVTNLRYSSGHEFVNLYWNDPENLDHIEITFDSGVSGITQPVIINAGIGTCELTGLENGTIYSFFVKAYSKLNHSSKTDTIKALPLNPTQIHDVDFNIYNTVTIGTQTWLRDNLRATKFQDESPFVNGYGELIPLSNFIGNESDKYGLYYYSIFASGGYDYDKNICPCGYHVPTDDEWKILESYLGMSEEDLNSTNYYLFRGETENIGESLKSLNGWLDYNGENGNGSDMYGFTILPSGYINDDVEYEIGETGLIWTSTRYDYGINKNRIFSNSSSGICRAQSGGGLKAPIRCIKD